MNEIQIIKKEVEQFFNLPSGAIDQHTRKREIKTARQLAHFLAKEVNGHSLAAIGREIGMVDHATVINSCHVIGTAISRDHRGKVYDPQTWAVVQRLRIKINDKLTPFEWANHIAQL